MVKENNPYFNLIKNNAIGAISLRKKKNIYHNDKKYNDKCKTAKSLISKISDPKIKAFFKNELDIIEKKHGGAASADISALADKAQTLRDSPFGRLAEGVIKATPQGRIAVGAMDKAIGKYGDIVATGTELAENVGLDKEKLAGIANTGIDNMAKGVADTLKKSKEMSAGIADASIGDDQDAKTGTQVSEKDEDSITEVKKNGNNINVNISVKGSGIDGSEEKPTSDKPPLDQHHLDQSSSDQSETIQDPSEEVQISETTAGNDDVERPVFLDDKESSKKVQSPSYPEHLQIIPLDPHASKKTSNVYTAYLNELKTKIDKASNIEASQIELVKKKQKEIDLEKKSTQKHIDDVAKQSDKNWIKILEFSYSAMADIIKAIWSVFQTMGIFFYRCIIAFIEFCRTHPVMTLCAIIAAIIVILLLTWFVFGVQLGYDSKSIEVTEPDTDESDKVQSTNDYSSCGQLKKFNFWDGLNNPAEYTFNYFKDGTEKLKSSTILNKLFYNSANAFGDLATGITGISLIEKYKSDRPINKKGDVPMQRVNNISYIDYTLLNEKIKRDIYKSEQAVENTAISLIKPKNIEWKFPYIDYYTYNSDANLLPDSIKRYKDKNNPTAYSLNDTHTLTFEWNREGRDYVLDCNPKFKDLNISKYSDLYTDDDNHCRAFYKPNTVFSAS